MRFLASDLGFSILTFSLFSLARRCIAGPLRPKASAQRLMDFVRAGGRKSGLIRDHPRDPR